MRQLLGEREYIHNRVRMIVGSFFSSKDLHLHLGRDDTTASSLQHLLADWATAHSSKLPLVCYGHGSGSGSSGLRGTDPSPYFGVFR
jgi:hypothetical protein